MAITVNMEFDSYTDFCKMTNLGKQILEYPETVLERLNEIFDGSEISGNGNAHPDNVYVNCLVAESDSEFLTGRDHISTEEFEKLMESDKLEEYIEENQDEINDNSDVTILCREDKTWYILY